MQRRALPRRPFLFGTAALACVLVLAACGSARAESARAVAERFAAAVAAGDAAAACSLLAPPTLAEVEAKGERCASAVPLSALGDRGLRQGAATSAAEAYGSEAWVRTGADAIFLARVAGQWLVSAAGCRPDPPGPYDCLVSGS